MTPITLDPDTLVRREPTVVLAWATPELVDRLLSEVVNSCNRSVRQSYVEYLAQVYERGEQVLINQGPGISSAGVLLDGQHRLLALRAAGYPRIPIWVFMGLDPCGQLVIDTGARRNRADAIRLALGVTVGNWHIAVANIIHRVRFGWTGEVRRPSPDQQMDLILELWEGFERAHAHGLAKLAAPVTAAFVIGYSANDAGRYPEIDGMADGITGTGAGLIEGSSTLTLRNWLNSNRGRSGGSEEQRERYEKTHRAIQAGLDGEELTRLYAPSLRRKTK